jgi:hypothetical protein
MNIFVGFYIIQNINSIYCGQKILIKLTQQILETLNCVPKFEHSEFVIFGVQDENIHCVACV